MKKAGIAIILAMVIGMGFFTTEGSAQMGGMMGQGGGWGQGDGSQQQQGWNCPNCGTWHGDGGMMGRGMMHRGGPQYQQSSEPMEEKDARNTLEDYLKSTRNPNLKLGKIEDKGTAFEAEIVTKKEGDLVDKVAVDKSTGGLRSVY